MSEYNAANSGEIGWDDEISNESSFTILLEGDYGFTVTAFERGRFPGSAKTPPCNKATLTLTVQADTGEASVKYDIIMHQNFEWKLCEFFRAIGQKKHGEPLRPRWNEVVGSTGRAHFKPRTYKKKDGSEGTSNDVEKFYDYDPEASQQEQTWMDLPKSSPTPWEAGKF